MLFFIIYNRKLGNNLENDKFLKISNRNKNMIPCYYWSIKIQ